VQEQNKYTVIKSRIKKQPQKRLNKPSWK